MITESNKGSEWNKWDLHIHTPFTKLSDSYKQIGEEDIWKSYCDMIESSDVVAFGITDYFCCKNYYALLEHFYNYYPESNKVFFPNIELRLDVSVNKKGEEVNIHVLFSNLVPRSKIEDFLSKLNTNITKTGAKISCKNLEGNEFESAGIKYSDLEAVLKEVFGKEKPYVIIAASNNAGLRPDTSSPRKLNITDEIDKICDGFFGGSQNIAYYLDTDRYETVENARSKPVISGSDSHSFEDLGNFLGKRFTTTALNGDVTIVKDITWIKADVTFEGLRQIFHEPEHRIRISDISPRVPLRKINTIKFNFPSTIKIKKNVSSEYQDLCIKNLKQEIPLNPYFTCFIGGRGTGKSTIINLIAERLNYNTDFFGPTENSLYLSETEASRYNVKEDRNNFVSISGTNDIEFVSQGKVEKLTEGEALTKLIFEERILQPNSELQSLKSKMTEYIELIVEQIGLVKLENSLNVEISEKFTEKSAYEGIISSISDPKYIKTTEEIKKITDKINDIENSIQKYSSLITRIKQVLTETIFDDSSKNEYENRVGEIIKYLMSLDELHESDTQIFETLKKYDQTDSDLIQLNIDLLKYKLSLTEFFEEKGTSEESIKDSQTANENLSKIELQIRILQEKLETTKMKIQANDVRVQDIMIVNTTVNSIIQNAILDLNNKLEIKNENVAAISYEYEFNLEKYTQFLFDEFKQFFKSYHIPGTSWDQVKEVLFLIPPDTTLLSLTFDEFIRLLNEKIDASSRRNTNYVTIVLEIFGSLTNFKIYKYLVFKNLFDVFEYVSINGFYGKRELKNCSFGQKCTAVMVTLLMSGVKPLVIDEPEAHLDNRLIADYLVDLIKEKKADRQIIFATHNANFVINGDAELIYILEVPEENVCTVTTATTIENLTNRDKLLKLEGGKKAFEKREKKLFLDRDF